MMQTLIVSQTFELSKYTRTFATDCDLFFQTDVSVACDLFAW